MEKLFEASWTDGGFDLSLKGIYICALGDADVV